MIEAASSSSPSPLLSRLRAVVQDPLPYPGGGRTAERHHRLAAIAREDVSLARLAEAHFDACAILHEAGRSAVPGALYGVWASEIPGQQLGFEPDDAGGVFFSGTKRFCTGAGIVDRALLTLGAPEPRLIDVDLRAERDRIDYDLAGWQTEAFAATGTATATFRGVRVATSDFVGQTGFYIGRPGFWHGACSPASCWAGAALGLVDFANRQKRNDPHTMAHLGGLRANAWALESYLTTAGNQIDAAPDDYQQAKRRALTVRHLVEQASTDILRRLTRAYGPYPLAFDAEVTRRYQELDLYLRQSHAERDLEDLARS